MQYLKTYDDFIGNTAGRRGRLCELTGLPAADIHHIDGRDFNGCDEIENLMALSREAHEFFGQKTDYKEFLVQQHGIFMETKTPMYLRDPWNKTMLKFLDSVKKTLYWQQ